MRSVAVAGVLALAFSFAACGNDRQDANEPEGKFALEVVDASFPEHQSTAQRSTMRLQVRNTDDRELPNLAVTVETEPAKGQAPSAFAVAQNDPRLADSARPVWILDRGPEGGETAYTNTWALGPLGPGGTKDVEFRLTAVRAGDYTVTYRVAPGLNGKAVAASERGTRGSFKVTISDKPVPARVNGKGEVVREEPGE